MSAHLKWDKCCKATYIISHVLYFISAIGIYDDEMNKMLQVGVVYVNFLW